MQYKGAMQYVDALQPKDAFCKINIVNKQIVKQPIRIKSFRYSCHSAA